MAKHNDIGKIGENITRTFLMKHGYSILSLNTHVRYGEIDIIAEKNGILHFIEVKSVGIYDFNKIEKLLVKPEDNMTPDKCRKLKRTINIYLTNDQKFSDKKRVSVDLACVYVNTEKREGRVKFIENIEL